MREDCQHIGELLSDYLDDDLGERERWEVKLHLERCLGCARLVAELAATVSALHRFRPSGVPLRGPPPPRPGGPDPRRAPPGTPRGRPS